jgi:transposase
MSRAVAQLLDEQGVSRGEIAERLGVSNGTVGAWLRRAPTFPQRACRLCGQAFTPTNGRQRFCNVEHWNEYQRRHRPPQTAAAWRERIHELEAELARLRQRIAHPESEPN